MPKYRFPISRKVVAQGAVGLIVAGLAQLGVVDLPDEWETWLTVGSGLAAGVAVPEAVKFLDYAAERLGLKVVDFEDTA